MRPLRPPRTAVLCLMCSAVLAACGNAASPPASDVPARDDWPLPNRAVGALERGARIAEMLHTQPALVDEVEFANGDREPATVLAEEAETITVLMAAGAGVERRTIPRGQIRRIHRATPAEAMQRRLRHLASLEARADGLARSAPKPEAPPEQAEASPVQANVSAPAPDVAGSGKVSWDLTRVASPTDLPGVISVAWWPARPEAAASSGVEQVDTTLDRDGLWALVTHGYGHDQVAVVEITIEATHLRFEHSPGYWGGPPSNLHDHWRLLVDGVVRLHFAPDQGEPTTQGRYPYRSMSISLGPGRHVVRWELNGCTTEATYFWGLDTLTWRGVVMPDAPASWGPLPG